MSTCHPWTGPCLPSQLWPNRREEGGEEEEEEGGKRKGRGRRKGGRGREERRMEGERMEEGGEREGRGRREEDQGGSRESRGPDSPAHGAHKAVGVVGLAQRRHHLALDELVAAEAAGPVQPLVVQRADVLTLPHEEAALGQVTAACWGEPQRQRGADRLPGPATHSSPLTQVPVQIWGDSPQPGAEWTKASRKVAPTRDESQATRRGQPL